MHFLWFLISDLFLLRMHFVDFARHCFGSFLANWRRSWWDQSWEACLECHCVTFDRDGCMNSLRYWWMSICSRSMVIRNVPVVILYSLYNLGGGGGGYSSNHRLALACIFVWYMGGGGRTEGYCDPLPNQITKTNNSQQIQARVGQNPGKENSLKWDVFVALFF